MTYNGCLPYTSTERHKHNLDWGEASKPWAFSAWLTFCSQRNNIFPCKSLSPLFAVGILLIYKWWQEVFTQIIQVQKSIYEVGISSPGNVSQERERTSVDMNFTPALQKGTFYLSFHPSVPHPRNPFFTVFSAYGNRKTLKKKMNDFYVKFPSREQTANCSGY